MEQGEPFHRMGERRESQLCLAMAVKRLQRQENPHTCGKPERTLKHDNSGQVDVPLAETGIAEAHR
jgi:hypothetical protein